MRFQSIANAVKKNWPLYVGVFAVVVLGVKFLFPLFRYDVPLGYDVGLYRYLFSRYATTDFIFAFPDLVTWETHHPPLLLYLVGKFIRIGIPIDWFVGWIWNVFTIITAINLAYIWYKLRGIKFAVVLLLVLCMSQAFFDLFTAMYWKNMAAMLLVPHVYYALEKNKISIACLLFIALALTHHLTAFVVGLSAVSWWLTEGYYQRKNIQSWLRTSLLGLLLGSLSLIWYWFNSEFVLNILRALSRFGSNEGGGAFPEPTFFIQISFIVLLFAIPGFFLSFKYKKGTIWQYSVLWPLIFVVLRLYFYRRFYFYVDFFLLPFAALCIVEIFQKAKNAVPKALTVVLIVTQITLALLYSTKSAPGISSDDLNTIKEINNTLDSGSIVLVPENISSMWAKGYMLDHRVFGPGLFDHAWHRNDWKTFIYGTTEERKKMLLSIDPETKFLIMPYFIKFYKKQASTFIQDPCLSPILNTPILVISCK